MVLIIFYIQDNLIHLILFKQWVSRLEFNMASNWLIIWLKCSRWCVDSLSGAIFAWLIFQKWRCLRFVMLLVKNCNFKKLSLTNSHSIPLKNQNCNISILSGNNFDALILIINVLGFYRIDYYNQIKSTCNLNPFLTIFLPLQHLTYS